MTDTPSYSLSAWWWPWVSVVAGVVAGLVGTLVLVAVVAQLIQLCAHDCDPRRAWPNLFCWRAVSTKLGVTWRQIDSMLFLQTSANRRLVDQVEGGVAAADVDSSGLDSSQQSCPSPWQRVRACLCRCCGHRG